VITVAANPGEAGRGAASCALLKADPPAIIVSAINACGNIWWFLIWKASRLLSVDIGPHKHCGRGVGGKMFRFARCSEGCGVEVPLPDCGLDFRREERMEPTTGIEPVTY